MISIAVLIIGLLSGSLLSVLVGLLGSRRRIGFGWAFLISVITSPLIGLIVTLCFPKLPNRDRKWGCLSALVGFVVIIIIVGIVLYFVPELYEQLGMWVESLS